MVQCCLPCGLDLHGVVFMNERIRSLLDRAEYQVGKQYGPDWEVYVEPSREQILEKFAELIVRECMWKIMQQKEEAIDNDWHVDEAMSAAISDISEHFGVEE
jgi:hypothetical protein